MHRYILGIEVEPVEMGGTYVHLPLHCTLVHWFLSEREPREIAAAVAVVLRNSVPVELVSVKSALYGPNNDVPVSVLVKDKALVDLHMNLFNVLDALQVEFTKSEYVGSAYNPHVTMRGGRSFSPGSMQKAERVYLAEALNDNVPPDKRIQAVLMLN